MFSIVIPSKNEEKNIERLFESIKRQSLQPNEVIVADKSTDKTAKVAKRYGAKVVEGVDNGKVGRGRNLGAKHVRTDIIVFLDADVELRDQYFLEDVLRMFQRKDLDIATVKVKGDRRKIRNTIYFESWHLFKKVGQFAQNTFVECGSCMVVKKSVFEKVGGFSETIGVGEDADFVRKIVKAGGSYKILPFKIWASDRRFAKPVHKLAFQLFGLLGIGAVTFIGLGLLRRNRHKFEKLYGELGGKGKSEGDKRRR